MLREPNPGAYDVIEALDYIVVATAEDDLDSAERWRRIAVRRLRHSRYLFGIVAVLAVGHVWRWI